VNDIHIILHCLPREIDELDRIVNHLKRSSHFLSPDDEVILDFTMNLSDKLTDWETSQLPKEFFADRFEMMEKKCDWTSKNIFEINDSNRCLGINDKREIVLEKIILETLCIWIQMFIFQCLIYLIYLEH